MNSPFQLGSLLVPIDFSPTSAAAFQHAMALATGKKPLLILLHVVDPSLVHFAVEHGWGSQKEVMETTHRHAEQRLAAYRQQVSGDLEIETIISDGIPFVEILRKAKDFAVDAIVIGKVGVRGRIEKILFGSTAEKVLRASQHPVIVLPFDEPAAAM
jgi:glycine betaine transporter